jgi:hypothetical protein
MKDYLPWPVEHLSSSYEGSYPNCRAIEGVGLRLFACWDYGFEFRRGYGCLSLVSVVSCQVDVRASGLQSVKYNEDGIPECNIVTVYLCCIQKRITFLPLFCSRMSRYF